MILLAGVVLAVIIALVRGGRLSHLGEIRIRWVWLVLVAVAIQLVLMRLVPDQPDLARVLFPLTHLTIVIVAWVNRDQRGMQLFAVGVALNLAVMAVNGGFMPVIPKVLVQAGKFDNPASVPLHTRRLPSKGFVMTKEETNLWWLSDIIPLPAPIKTVMSIGDILMAGGIFFLVQKTMLAQKGPL